MKKIIYSVISIVMISAGGSSIYMYNHSRTYLVNGSYQGEVLNEQEERMGMYTINFEDQQVTLFSAFFDESFTGNLNTLYRNEYELHFEEFDIPFSAVSDEEIQLVINEQDYTFLKKSDVPVWENID